MALATNLPYKAVGLMRLASRTFLAPACWYPVSKGHGIRPTKTGPEITPDALLPDAVAVIEASQLPRPLVGSSVSALLDDLYCQPVRLASRASQLPTSLARRMG